MSGRRGCSSTTAGTGLHAQRALRRLPPGLLPQPPLVRPERSGWARRRTSGAIPSAKRSPAKASSTSPRRPDGTAASAGTQKINFLSLNDIEYGRTRLIDDGWGYSSEPDGRLHQRGGPVRRHRRLQGPPRGLLHPGQSLAYAHDRGERRALVRHRLRFHRRRERRARPALPRDRHLLVAFPLDRVPGRRGPSPSNATTRTTSPIRPDDRPPLRAARHDGLHGPGPPRGDRGPGPAGRR